jgi:hypothetical protein
MGAFFAARHHRGFVPFPFTNWTFDLSFTLTRLAGRHFAVPPRFDEKISSPVAALSFREILPDLTLIF